jgi:CBS domain containing-hemolysin-like protein
VILLALGAVIILLLLNGLFVGAEFAFVAASKDVIQERAAGGNARAGAALREMNHLSAALAGAQLGITMASLGLGFVAEPAIAHLIQDALHRWINIPSAVAHGIAIPTALTIVVYLHMVIGEMVPKNITIAEPERAAMALALPFRLSIALFRPLVILLNAMANGLLRLTGIDPAVAVRPPATGEDLSFLITASRRDGLIQGLEHQMLSGALTFSDRSVAEVMAPRTLVTAAPITATTDDLEALSAKTGYSRIPICKTGLDDVVGFIHMKDLLGIPTAERTQPVPFDSIRPLPVVPESAALDQVLMEIRRRRSHMALVVDEHGGVSGIITLEDLVEELVGELFDEHDPISPGVTATGASRYRLPGMLRPDEVAEAIGAVLPEGDWHTLGGWLMAELGRVPRPGDRVRADEWEFTVVSLERRRVTMIDAEWIGPADSGG